MTLSILFRNQSGYDGHVYVYQANAGFGSNVFSPAWFSGFAFKAREILFEWQLEYDFVWSVTGLLRPGVRFIAGQTWRANLSAQNQVTLTYEPRFGAYSTFAVQAQPDLSITLTPRPEYWTVFGDFRQGEVLDVQSIKGAGQVVFRRNVRSMVVTLNKDGS